MTADWRCEACGGRPAEHPVWTDDGQTMRWLCGFCEVADAMRRDWVPLERVGPSRYAAAGRSR